MTGCCMIPLRSGILNAEAMMMKTMKHLLLGMGLGAAVMTALWKNPKSRQAMNDAMQTAADKAEDLKNTLEM